MSGGRHDDDQVDVAALTDDQREGLACITCGTAGGPMRSIPTPDNPQSTMVFAHDDSEVCLRYIGRYITGLHTRLVGIAEHAVDALARRGDAADP